VDARGLRRRDPATTGPALLLEGSAGPLTAAVLTVVGAMLAERGLRNATRALDRFDAATDASPAAAGAGVPPGALPPGRPLPAV
jgi:hypothetical protein